MPKTTTKEPLYCIRIVATPHATEVIGKYEQSWSVPGMIKLMERRHAEQRAYILTDQGYACVAEPVPPKLYKDQARFVRAYIRPKQSRPKAVGDDTE